MKSKKQILKENRMRERICLRAHRDGLDITNCNLKTLNVVAKLYKTIDDMEEYDKQLLADYAANAISINSLVRVSGIVKSTLEKEPYASIINRHRRKSKKEIKNDGESSLREEIATLRQWKDNHREMELMFLEKKKELKDANNTILELNAKLKRKDELIRQFDPQNIDPKQKTAVLSFPVVPGDIES